MIRILAAFALALASLAGTAQAETVKVSYSDLNLSNKDGMKILGHRVSAAITAVCGEVGPDNLADAASINACRKAAKVSTVQQIASIVNGSQRLAMNDTGLRIASR